MSEGVKYDNDKPRWGLLPFKEVEQIVDVLTFGSKKYSDDNWKKVDNAHERYFDAMLRHITEYRYGNKNDSETGKSHLAHAMCCGLFMMWFDNLPKSDNGTLFVEKDGVRFDLKPTDLENYYIDDKISLLNGFEGEQLPDDDTCKLYKGVASLTTEPKVKPTKDCCYSNFGNTRSIDKCEPFEILRCLQNTHNDNDKKGNHWYHSTIMKPLSENGEYVYFGENCTETFFFALLNDEFLRID